MFQDQGLAPPNIYFAPPKISKIPKISFDHLNEAT